MTEDEWLRATDPAAMLEALTAAGAASERKLRLFAVACTWAVEELLWANEYSRLAMRCAELFADALATAEDLARSRTDIESRLELYPDEPVYDAAYWACSADISAEVKRCAFYAANVSMTPFRHEPDEVASAVRVGTVRQQADLLRCIAGSPFRPVPFDPAWRTHAAVALAEAAYEERAWEGLPILADALADAGCEEEVILGHLRGGGPHARGCWVLDGVWGRG